MDFLLSGPFARFDAWFLVANLAFLMVAAVSYVVEKLFWLFRVVSPIKQNHAAQASVQPQQPEQSEAKASTTAVREDVKASSAK